MTITAQRLLDELGRRAWSGFAADDMDFTSTDSAQAQAELNAALRYLVNQQDFPFKCKEKQIETTTGAETFSMVEGQISYIYNAETLAVLDYIADSGKYDKEVSGVPSAYWIDYNNPKQKIRLYPIPDGTYNLNIVYNQFQPVIDKDGKTKKYEFENPTDFINLPANLEFLFMDCLVLRTIITNMKDEQDENYQPAINEFKQAWKVFVKASKPKRQEVRVVL